MTELFILFLLVLLNGIFAMAEMSVVAARKARLQQWSDEGRPGAAAALALATEPGHFLSTTQIGITIIGIVSGAFAGATVAQSLAEFLGRFALLQAHAGTLSLTVVVAAIAVCSLVIGELVPKRIALLHPEAIASAIAGPMRLLTTLTYPLVRAISFATESVLRLLFRAETKPPTVTQEEIRALMKQGTAAGVFDRQEQAMVARVFRMDERRVTSVMTPRVDIRYLDTRAPFDVNRQTLLQGSHSRYPLCNGGLDDIVGVVQARRLLEDALQDRPFDPGRHADKPLFVPDGMTLTGLLEALKRHRCDLALVVDEYGEIQGLVTMSDVMEALVGDIGVAEESIDADIVRRDDTSWIVDGAVAAQRLREVAGLEAVLAGEESQGYDTLGGFVMMTLRRVPRVGDRVDAGGWRFEVVDMDGNRVDKLLLSRLNGPTAAKG